MITQEDVSQILPCRLHYSGGADQARTDDPLLAKQVLYQLSYNPKTLHFQHESEWILYFFYWYVNIKMNSC